VQFMLTGHQGDQQQRISSGLPFQFSPDPSRDAACNTCPAGTEIQVSVDSHFAGMSDKGRKQTRSVPAY
jgi:hypothetical protein